MRLLDALVGGLNLDNISKLYRPNGRNPYHPRMMLKVILYAYMNNIYSCRRIEALLKRDIHFIRLSGYEQPDFITVNRFRNRVKDEINNIFTQIVLILSYNGLISLDVEYIDGTKIESKANRYTFVRRKSVGKNRSRLLGKIKALLSQIDDTIAQDNMPQQEAAVITPELLTEIAGELNRSLEAMPEAATKEQKRIRRQRQLREIEKQRDRLREYDRRLEKAGGRDSYSKTDNDATFIHMKEDAMNNGQTKPGYNLQIAAENQFITDFALYPNPADTLTMPSFLGLFRSRYGHYAKTVVADSEYGPEENCLFMDVHGIDAYVKYNYFHRELKLRNKPDPFHSSSLYYNREQDFYVCPMGQRMRRTDTKRTVNDSGFISYSARYRAQRCGDVRSEARASMERRTESSVSTVSCRNTGERQGSC